MDSMEIQVMFVWASFSPTTAGYHQAHQEWHPIYRSLLYRRLEQQSWAMSSPPLAACLWRVAVCFRATFALSSQSCLCKRSNNIKQQVELFQPCCSYHSCPTWFPCITVLRCSSEFCLSENGVSWVSLNPPANHQFPVVAKQTRSARNPYLHSQAQLHSCRKYYDIFFFDIEGNMIYSVYKARFQHGELWPRGVLRPQGDDWET